MAAECGAHCLVPACGCLEAEHRAEAEAGKLYTASASDYIDAPPSTVARMQAAGRRNSTALPDGVVMQKAEWAGYAGTTCPLYLTPVIPRTFRNSSYPQKARIEVSANRTRHNNTVFVISEASNLETRPPPSRFMSQNRVYHFIYI